MVGHVHVYLSYLDGIEIGLVLDDALDNVMVTHYLDSNFVNYMACEYS